MTRQSDRDLTAWWGLNATAAGFVKHNALKHFTRSAKRSPLKNRSLIAITPTLLLSLAMWQQQHIVAAKVSPALRC